QGRDLDQRAVGPRVAALHAVVGESHPHLRLEQLAQVEDVHRGPEGQPRLLPHLDRLVEGFLGELGTLHGHSPSFGPRKAARARISLSRSSGLIFFSSRKASWSRSSSGSSLSAPAPDSHARSTSYSSANWASSGAVTLRFPASISEMVGRCMPSFLAA